MSGSLRDKQTHKSQQENIKVQGEGKMPVKKNMSVLLSENESIHTADNCSENLATGLANVKCLILTHTSVSLILHLQIIGKSWSEHVLTCYLFGMRKEINNRKYL